MIERRQVLRLLVAAGVATWAMGCDDGEDEGPSGPPIDGDAGVAGRLSGGVDLASRYIEGDDEPALELGRLYLAERGIGDTEADRDTGLTRALDLIASAATADEAEDLLRAEVRADFRAKRLFSVQGWTLSDIEGQICALLVPVG